jgi:phage terminase large subunit GpA-like protein
VPCPHCGEAQPLRWKQLQWDRRIREARYVCPQCGAEILEHHKPAMLAAGRWVPTVEDVPAWRRGYHLNKLYSPIGLGSSWVDLAREWVSVQDDKVRLKRFINTSLAETWEDDSGKVEPHVLMQRAESYKLREIPPGCLALTAGVDTQDDRLAVQIVGWGAGRLWVIDWTTIMGDTQRPETWERLEAYLLMPILNAWGRRVPLAAAAIDRGGHRTPQVDEFAHKHRGRLWISVAGSRYYGKSILAKAPTKVEGTPSGRTAKWGLEYWEIGADVAKSQILQGWLVSDAAVEPDKRVLRFSHELQKDYYDELTAEVFDPEINRWRKRAGGRRNEGLDTLIYALAAGRHPRLRLHKRTRAQWDAEAMLLEREGPALAAEPQPAEKPVAPMPPTADIDSMIAAARARLGA